MEYGNETLENRGYRLVGIAVDGGRESDIGPTEYTSGVAQGYYNPPYAYDGNLETAATGYTTNGGEGAHSEIETWYGFASAPPGASGMTLNINSSATAGNGADAILLYSLDGGNTWTYVYGVLDSSRAKQTDVILLSNSQDLTKVQVKAEVTAFESSASQAIYEIWISGTD